MRNNKNNITLRFKNITLCLLILTLSSINIINTFTYAPNTFALNYQSSTNIGFTFNPTISVSISPNNLIIPNLTPGTAADSNPITVSVSTNTAYGYHLTANVGSNTTNYNTTNLVHTTSTPTTNATFTSLAYGSSVANKDNLSPNTWGYSYSNDSGTTWRPYSGLPLYSDTNHSANLISTYTAADSRSIEFKIAAKASETQPSGDYTNIINFYATSVPEPPLLYDVVEDMTKGTLAENNVKLSDTITQANSGVYTYDPAVYGVASDASNDYPIYFYRGILDTDAGLGTYGSDGKADAWPNYVKLGNNTCWWIVRTTGSGGIKMIYNGTWNGSTCANSVNDAQIVKRSFNWTYQSIVSVGYTFNDEYKTITEDTNYSTLFGTNDNYNNNNTNSDIKGYLENTWFTGVMLDYEGRLETSAGYCNDRTVYDTSGALINNDDVIVAPYDIESSGVQYNFGAKRRVQNPSLLCPRNKADLYTTDVSANGNKQLVKPVALLTADESIFAGLKNNSFLYSGYQFWLLSPDFRKSSAGRVNQFTLGAEGGWGSGLVSYSAGYRPVISLMHYIQVTSGSGTATSPWMIE